MINVKDQIYAAISAAVENVTDPYLKGRENVTDSYPKSWENLPAVQYMEEENNVAEWTDDREQKSYCRYRVDIWNNRSTSEVALKIDQAISALGLKRSQCMDVDDPSGLKHKVMRYEMVIDVNTQEVYHNM